MCTFHCEWKKTKPSSSSIYSHFPSQLGRISWFCLWVFLRNLKDEMRLRTDADVDDVRLSSHCNWPTQAPHHPAPSELCPVPVCGRPATGRWAALAAMWTHMLRGGRPCEASPGLQAAAAAAAEAGPDCCQHHRPCFLFSGPESHFIAEEHTHLLPLSTAKTNPTPHSQPHCFLVLHNCSHGVVSCYRCLKRLCEDIFEIHFTVSGISCRFFVLLPYQICWDYCILEVCVNWIKALFDILRASKVALTSIDPLHKCFPQKSTGHKREC